MCSDVQEAQEQSGRCLPGAFSWLWTQARSCLLRRACALRRLLVLVYVSSGKGGIKQK